MASAVAMMIGAAVVNALAFTGGNFYSQNLEIIKTLRKKEKDMLEQSNSWRRLKQLGVKRECKDWIYQ